MNFRVAEDYIRDLAGTEIDFSLLPIVELEETHRLWDRFMVESIESAMEDAYNEAARRHDAYRATARAEGY